MMKSLPTDMELGYAGFEDAGSFFAELGKKPEVLRQWRDEHRSDWDVGACARDLTVPYVLACLIACLLLISMKRKGGCALLLRGCWMCWSLLLWQTGRTMTMTLVSHHIVRCRTCSS